MRVNKYIASTGYCSRRKADALISAGDVLVNGSRLTDFSYQIQREDVVQVKGKILSRPLEKKYYLYHKPCHSLCSHEDPFAERLIYDDLPQKEGLFSVGRLDYDSEGLLLITNDGDFANSISHPSFQISKRYLVWLNKPFSEKLAYFQNKDIYFDGEAYHIDALMRVDRNELKKWNASILLNGDAQNVMCIRVHEGKKREVRKIFQALHYEVKRLVRISIGEVVLSDLAPGEYRALTRKERETLWNHNPK